MKRLFKVESTAGDPVRVSESGDVLYFDNKREAKVVRDAMTEETKIPHHITLGPDHWRYGWGS